MMDIVLGEFGKKQYYEMVEEVERLKTEIWGEEAEKVDTGNKLIRSTTSYSDVLTNLLEEIQ